MLAPISFIKKNKFRPIVSVWRTTVENETITLPYSETGSYRGTINWGDGTITKNNYENRTHTYLFPGDYTITINGKCKGFAFGNSGDKDKIIKIIKFGDLFFGGGTFYGCTNIDFSEVEDIPSFRNTTYIGLAFRFCRSMTYINNAHLWNIKNLQNCDAMFDGCTNFLGQDPEGNGIGQWDTSYITNMNNMLRSCPNFDTDLGAWNVSRVYSFGKIFNGGSSFNNGGSDSIKNWKFRKQGGNYFREAFLGANSFNQPIGEWKCLTDEEGVYTDFKIGNATGMMRTSSFDQPLDGWDFVIGTPDSRFMGNKTPETYSAVNLDANYIAWAAKPVINPKTISFGTAVHTSASAEAKQSLIDNYGWTIIDGGQI